MKKKKKTKTNKQINKHRDKNNDPRQGSQNA